MEFKSLVESYPLSPMQQGMLFHSLYAPQSGVDIEQMIIDLPENLNIPAFKQAWHRLVQQHPVLRTSFHWEGLKEPRQEVQPQANLPFEQHDLRALAPQPQKN